MRRRVQVAVLQHRAGEIQHRIALLQFSVLILSAGNGSFRYLVLF